MKARMIQQAVSLVIIMALSIAYAGSQAHAENAPGVAYRTVTIENIDIFYREAGDPTKRRYDRTGPEVLRQNGRCHQKKQYRAGRNLAQ